MASNAAGTTLRLSPSAERRLPDAHARPVNEGNVIPSAARRSDEDLLALCQSGDTDGLATLFDRYARLVLSIAVRILKDQAEAEDLLQDIFLHIHEKSRNFDPTRGMARSWIIHITYCMAIDRRARLVRRAFYSGTEISELQDTLKEETRLEDRVSAQLSGEQVRREFDQLTEKQRKTLELFFFQGLTLREISERSGRVTPLLTAPIAASLAWGDVVSGTWSEDGDRLLLTNTFLPLDGQIETERSRRLRPCAVADVELVSHKTQCIVYSRDGYIATEENPTPLRLERASFGTSKDEVVLNYGWRDGRMLTEWYRLQDGDWKLSRSLPEQVEGGGSEHSALNAPDLVSLQIKEDINEPPTLWATDVATSRSAKIWDPNHQQFKEIRFGEGSVYRWKDQNGYEWAGGLFKPVGFIPGRRYPLVIQTHGFEEHVFITDGSYQTAMAARALATAGIMVLQVDTRRDHMESIREPDDQLLGFQSAVDSLSRAGLVDPGRVGIIGFSRTSWYVEYALIERPHLFVAATIADGADYSYMQYLLEVGGNRKPDETINGGKPFGSGLQRWIERATGFRLYQVRTPVRIEAIGPLSILEEWEIYSSLQGQEKPVDLVYFPRGEHTLERPLERLASEQGNVDWFRFWLENYEDPNSEKKEQYERWSHLRELRDSQTSSSALTGSN
jgi:RNA polymerase sigma factor (sigma-70 family)